MSTRSLLAGAALASMLLASPTLMEEGVAQKGGGSKPSPKPCCKPVPKPPKPPSPTPSPTKPNPRLLASSPADVLTAAGGPPRGVGQKQAEQRVRAFQATRNALNPGGSTLVWRMKRWWSFEPEFRLRRASPYLDRAPRAGGGNYIFPYVLAAGLHPPSPTQMVAGSDMRPGAAVLNVLPATREQYQRVFDRPDVSADARAQMRQAARLLEENFEGVREIGDGRDFLDALGNSPEDVLIILGHNDKGFIRTPTGHWLTIKEASRRCMVYGKMCIFLTCQSARYLRDNRLGVARDLSIVEAVGIAKEIKEALERERTKERALRPRESGIFAPRELILADPHGAMKRLTAIIGRDRSSIYVGVLRSGLFIVISAIVTGDEDV